MIPSKSAMIYQALLRVNGGNLTSDADTRYGEAEVYLAMAVNFVMTGNYWLENKAEGGYTINPLLLTSFENIPVLFDTGRQQKYSDLPKRVLTLPKAKALELNTMCGKRIIPLDQGDDAMSEYYDQFKTVINYQVEGQRVWFWSIPPLIAAIRGKQIVHVGDLEDDDEVLLPSDGYVKVEDMMVQWLSGEKAAPKDLQEDAIDN